MVDKSRMSNHLTVTTDYVYVGMICELRVKTDREILHIYMDNNSKIMMTSTSKQMTYKLGYKSILRLIVSSFTQNINILGGSLSHVNIMTNESLRMLNLNVNIQLMRRSSAYVCANVVIAKAINSFKTCAIALTEGTDVKLIYNIVTLRKSLLSVEPTFTLKGRTTKCTHSMTISNGNDNAAYVLNRLICAEDLIAITIYSRCIT